MTNQSPKRLRRSALKSATGSPLPWATGSASSDCVGLVGLLGLVGLASDVGR